MQVHLATSSAPIGSGATARPLPGRSALAGWWARLWRKGQQIDERVRCNVDRHGGQPAQGRAIDDELEIRSLSTIGTRADSLEGNASEETAGLIDSSPHIEDQQVTRRARKHDVVGQRRPPSTPDPTDAHRHQRASSVATPDENRGSEDASREHGLRDGNLNPISECAHPPILSSWTARTCLMDADRTRVRQSLAGRRRDPRTPFVSGAMDCRQDDPEAACLRRDISETACPEGCGRRAEHQG